MGASGFGYDLARQFGLGVHETRAALVPFTFTGPMHAMTERLAGISTAATVTVNGVAFSDDILFTHRGLSGPAILQASSYWQPGDEISIDLMPDRDAAAWLTGTKQTLPSGLPRTVLAKHLPRKLVVELQDMLWPGDAETPLAEWSNEGLKSIGRQIANWKVRPAATEGYRTAEVTLGGVDTAALSSRTLESKDIPGLYFVGEVVDVTGHLGGFNFQWAWSSGYAAGLAA
jgi:predicted Rossmann fold flavoprotein